MNVRRMVLPLFLTTGFFALIQGLSGNDAVDRAHKYEDAGDSAAAREVYSRALQTSPRDPSFSRAMRNIGTVSRFRRA